MNIVLKLVDVSVESYRKIVLNRINWATLLKLINGYQRIPDGEIGVLGEEFGSVDVRELRKNMGFVSSYIVESFSQEENGRKSCILNIKM